MLARTWQEIEYCLDVVCVTDGAHVDVCTKASNINLKHFPLL